MTPQSQETDSLETRAELAVLRTYVESKAILEPILLYRTSKCKQTEEQGSKDCLWTHIFFLFYVMTQSKQDQTVNEINNCQQNTN